MLPRPPLDKAVHVKIIDVATALRPPKGAPGLTLWQFLYRFWLWGLAPEVASQTDVLAQGSAQIIRGGMGGLLSVLYGHKANLAIQAAVTSQGPRWSVRQSWSQFRRHFALLARSLGERQSLSSSEVSDFSSGDSGELEAALEDRLEGVLGAAEEEDDEAGDATQSRAAAEGTADSTRAEARAKTAARRQGRRKPSFLPTIRRTPTI